MNEFHVLVYDCIGYRNFKLRVMCIRDNVLHTKHHTDRKKKILKSEYYCNYFSFVKLVNDKIFQQDRLGDHASQSGLYYQNFIMSSRGM